MKMKMEMTNTIEEANKIKAITITTDTVAKEAKTKPKEAKEAKEAKTNKTTDIIEIRTLNNVIKNNFVTYRTKSNPVFFDESTGSPRDL